MTATEITIQQRPNGNFTIEKENSSNTTKLSTVTFNDPPPKKKTQKNKRTEVRATDFVFEDYWGILDFNFIQKCIFSGG